MVMKTFTGLKVKANQSEGRLNRANELNLFFNRFSTVNVAKTKEKIADFKRTRTKRNTISILGEEVKVMEDYR